MKVSGRSLSEALAFDGLDLARLDPFSTSGSISERVTREALKFRDPLDGLRGVRQAVEEAMFNIGRLDTTSLVFADARAARLSSLSGHAFGSLFDERTSDVVRRLTEGYSVAGATRSAMLDLTTNAIGTLYRTRNWAETLAGSGAVDYAALLGTGDRYRRQFEALNLAAGSLAAATASLSAHGAAAQITAFRGHLAGIDRTATKMSLFAGAIDVLGPGAGGSRVAYDALLGGYSSQALFAHPHWSDPRERARYYRDQEVDEGLIDSDNATTVAALIDSGVVEGSRTRAGTLTAVVEAGPVKLRIMASRPRAGAFGAIEAFEVALRSFVSAKLETVAGGNWFKMRVPGDVMSRAKGRRREAMRAGEAPLPLLDYTDLGDLISVILRKDNWSELFEVVFDRAEWLKVDLERLNAHRRPTMHSRPVDPVQLCEIVLTIRRLASWMDMDGAWDRGWSNDF